MSVLRMLSEYLNPVERLGNKSYSIFFPVITSILTAVVLEIIFHYILKNPQGVGFPAIFLFIALIIYFSFRDAIRGGSIVASITLIYYVYLIITFHQRGTQLIASVETTIVLGIIYFLLALIIGLLKQQIDTLIEKEADGKRRLETIIQQLPVGVLITDSNGKIVQANRQADVILGIKTPYGFEVGEKNLVPSLYKGKPLKPQKTPLLQVLQTGKAVVGKEFVLPKGQNKNLIIQVNAAPIHNKSGKIIAAALIFNDITIQKELEARKDDFVNMASHELKTPLTSMKLYIDILYKNLKEQKNQKNIKMIHQIQIQTEKLQQLVNDLLDVSRLQTGKLTFQKETFRLDVFITETLEQFAGGNKEQKILFSQKSPLNVFADKFRLYQVLTNIISNAIKYSSGKGDIIVNVKKVGGSAVVSIKDFGIGIEKSQQHKIFQRLYQVTDAKEQTFPGFGMGLYIAKEIIKRHKGAIWVESDKGKGATFSFRLPLVAK